MATTYNSPVKFVPPETPIYIERRDFKSILNASRARSLLITRMKNFLSFERHHELLLSLPLRMFPYIGYYTSVY